MSNLVIQFANLSSRQWNVDQNSDANLQKGGNSVQKWPAAPLVAYSGTASCEVTENLAKLDVGPSDFFFCWNDGNFRFGVKVIAYLQVLGAGDRPSWQVMADYNPNNPNIDWANSGSSPANQYSWTQDASYSIVGTPQSTHQSLSIQVIINDN